MSETQLERDPIEALADEFMDRYRRGEHPSVEQYAAAHPDLAEQIRDLFPTIAALEQFKIGIEQPADGRASLGPTKLERLGDFRIVGEIGRGGMGIVYEAEQESLGRHVAVKVLPRQSLLDAKHLKRFQREASAAARLHHTNIVPVFGVGEHDGFHYYVMQYIRGVGLDEIITRLKHTLTDDVNSADSTTGAPLARGGRATEVAQIAAALIGGGFRQPRKAESSADSRASAERRADKQQPSAEASEAATPFALTGDWKQEVEKRSNGTNDPPSPKLAAETIHASTSHADTSGLGAVYWQTVARMGIHVADALQYAHQQGTLHRDIKPANLLLDAYGVVWVTDFGLAKAMEQEAISRTGDVVGTLRYMAPEQLHGRADTRSDIYSLGLTLYELLTLQPAYEETELKQSLLQQVAAAMPTRPRKLIPAIPRDLETIVLKAIAVDPAHRYQTGAELANDLQRYLEDRPIHARRITPVERLWRWCRRNPVIAGLTATALVLLMAIVVVTTVAYAKTSQALTNESQQRAKAEQTLDISLEALDQVYQQFVPDQIVATSQLTVQSAAGQEIDVPVQPVISKQTAALLQGLLSFYDRFSTQGSDNARLRQETAKANRRVGDIQQRLGQFKPAETAYRKAVAVYEQLLAEAPQNGRYLIEIARLHNELGNVFQLTQRGDEAERSYRAALAILQSLAAGTPPEPEIQYELARTQYNLGRRRRPFSVASGGPPPTRGKPGGREKPPGPPSPLVPGNRDRERHLEDAVNVLENLVQRYPSIPAYQQLLALCYRDRSSGPFLRDNEQEQDNRSKAIAIFEKLRDDFPGNPQYRHDLAETYAAMDFREMMFSNNRAVAEKQLRKAVDISSELAKDYPDVPEYAISDMSIRNRLASVLYRQADLSDSTRREALLDEAEHNFRAAHDAAASIVTRFPDAAPHKISVARIEQSLAEVLRDRNKLEEARLLIESSIAELNQLAASDPRMWFIHYPLSDAYRTLAGLLNEMGEDDSAIEATLKAEQHRQQARGRQRGNRGGRPADSQSGESRPGSSRSENSKPPVTGTRETSKENLPVP